MKYPYEEKDRLWWVLYSPAGLIIGLVLFIGAMIGVYFLLKSPEKAASMGGSIPIIKAPTENYKETSDVMDKKVEHQDKEVYKRLGSSEKEEEYKMVEARPVQDHETPIDLESLENQTPVSVVNDNTEYKKISEHFGVQIPLQKTEEKEKEPEVTKQKQKTEVIATKLQEKSDDPVLSPGKYVIRVASLKKKDTAIAELKRTLKLLANEPNPVGGAIKKLTSSGGEFFVVNVGGFATIDEAEHILLKLNAKGLHAHIQKVK
jgi:cell division septation protein DedD